jgi:ADP-heptose:LPS heptosyltransferase
LLARLGAIPGLRFYILQSSAPEAGWDGNFGVYPGELSLVAYARIVRALDLLISVDTMAVHLAGALGVPAWVLLHAQANWRWMQDRDDSPWYPTMRLFRQEHPDDWEGVVARVAAALEQLGKLNAAPGA